MADTNDPQPAYRIKSVAPPTISNLEGNIIREIAESTISVGKQDRYVRSGVKGRSELATIHRPILWFLPSSKDPGGWLDLLAGFRYTYLGEQVGLQANNMAIDGASTQLVNQFAQQVATPGSDLRTLIQQNIVRNRANRRSTCLAIDPERIRAALGASSVGP